MGKVAFAIYSYFYKSALGWIFLCPLIIIIRLLYEGWDTVNLFQEDFCFKWTNYLKFKVSGFNFGAHDCWKYSLFPFTFSWHISHLIRGQWCSELFPPIKGGVI